MTGSEQQAKDAITAFTNLAIEKINENASMLFSRLIQANERAEALCNDVERRAKQLARTVDNGRESVAAATKNAKAAEDRLNSVLGLAEDIDVRLRIASAKADGMLELNGKTVRLKSGGHLMTASGFADDGGVLCLWAVEGDVFKQSIPAIALEVASSDT